MALAFRALAATKVNREISGQGYRPIAVIQVMLSSSQPGKQLIQVTQFLTIDQRHEVNSVGRYIWVEIIGEDHAARNRASPSPPSPRRGLNPK